MGDAPLERVLVVTAHPDDVDFGVAGSVASWTDAGIAVTYCLVTDGEAGGSDRSISRAEMAEIRRAEQTAAAKVVGVDDVVFLGYPDGRLQPTLDLRRDISRAIRQVRPQRVVTQSPDRNYERIYASQCRVPRRSEPVRASGAPRRRGARAVVGRRDVADGGRDTQPVRGRHRHLRPQD